MKHAPLVILSLLLLAAAPNAFASVMVQVGTPKILVIGGTNAPLCYANFSIPNKKPATSDLAKFREIRELRGDCKEKFSAEDVEKISTLVSSLQNLGEIQFTVKNKNDVVSEGAAGGARRTYLMNTHFFRRLTGDFAYFGINEKELVVFRHSPLEFDSENPPAPIVQEAIKEANAVGAKNYAEDTRNLMATVEKGYSILKCVPHFTVRVKQDDETGPGLNSDFYLNCQQQVVSTGQSAGPSRVSATGPDRSVLSKP